MIEIFKVGDAVVFQTTEHTNFSKEGRKMMFTYPEHGVITKLMRSGRNGSAVIRTAKGHVTRRLQMVAKEESYVQGCKRGVHNRP
jgi:predicted glycosyltransferase